MLMFCPTCGNMLLLEQKVGDARLYCQTCPYVYNITAELVTPVKTERKKVDDVLGGEDAWKNVAKTDAKCGRCGHGQAYFMEMQLRSADEPATLFFRCVKCGHNWREG